MGREHHIKSNNGLGTLSIVSQGKTNLLLRITGKLPHGYHKVFTIMSRIDMFDRITISPLPSGNTKDIVVFFSCSKYIKHEDIDALNALEMSASVDGLEGGTSISKIVKLLRQEYGDIVGLTSQFFHIIVEKNIPPGSGLGGSSSNAHATLQGVLNIMSSTLSKCIMYDLLKVIGADAPFFLHQKPQLCHGRGDTFLSNVNLPQEMSLVVILPQQPNLTYQVYDEYMCQNDEDGYSKEVLDHPIFADVPDVMKPHFEAHPNSENGSCEMDGESSAQCVALEAMDDLIPLMKNDLLEAALAVNAELREMWSVLFTKVKKYNSSRIGFDVGIILNGSGSSVSVVCFDQKAAQYFTTELKRLFPSYYVGLHSLVQGSAKVQTLEHGEQSRQFSD